MSDEKNATKTDSVHVNHYCEHPGCKKWGAFGFENRRQARIDWYCMEHRPIDLVRQD